MSFLMGQSKKQISNINSKKAEEKKKPLSQRAYFQKLFLNRYQNDLNTNLANYKGNKKLTSKYNTLKNSRKYIQQIINFLHNYI